MIVNKKSAPFPAYNPGQPKQPQPYYRQSQKPTPPPPFPVNNPIRTIPFPDVIPVKLSKDLEKRILERLHTLNLNELEAKIPTIELTEQDLQELEHILDDFSHFDARQYYRKDTTMPKVKTGWMVSPDGTRKHYNENGVLHNSNGPAEIRTNGTELYYQNGNLHRDGNRPAMVGIKGTEKYAIDGHYHRLGGLPAITWSRGPYRYEWWVNGEIQKAQRKDGTMEYYAPGSTEREEAILHRTDGPAVQHQNGTEEFWLHGRQYNNEANWLAALELDNLDRGLIDEDPVEAIEEALPSTVKTVKTTTRVATKEEKTMNTNVKPTFTDTLKQNAVSAGYRVAGTQATTIVKNAILTVMRNKGADGGAIQGISAFLDTEFGEALIAFALGSGLHYVPHFNEDPRVQRLGEELRVGGMATAGNAVIGEAMAHVLPALTQVLQNLPALDSNNNVRVVESSENKLVEAMEEEEAQEEEKTTAKTMKA